MKISLILFLCSYTASTCMPGFEYPTKFNDMYDCLNAGYVESIKKIDEIGRESKEDFMEHGGENFNFIPCLNSDEIFIEALMDIHTSPDVILL